MGLFDLFVFLVIALAVHVVYLLGFLLVRILRFSVLGFIHTLCVCVFIFFIFFFA